MLEQETPVPEGARVFLWFQHWRILIWWQEVILCRIPKVL